MRKSALLAQLFVVLAAVWLGACATIPPGRAAVGSIEVRGGDAVDGDDVEERLATAPSPKFLGLWSGVVFDYELYDEHVLARDLQRVERFYRARGFYEAHARAARVTRKGNHVSITIEVEEGPCTSVGKVTPTGVEWLPIDATAAVVSALHALERNGRKCPDGSGVAFDEDVFADVEKEARTALTERGFAYAEVRGEASVDLVRHVADVTFTVVPGKKARFGKVTIEGLGDLPEKPVRRALAIRSNAEYSTATLESAQRAALNLGVFSSVEVVPDLSNPDAEVVNVTVRVAPTKLRAVRLGGGIELDVLKTDLHLTTGWEDRNFLGGLRRFSIDVKPGVVLFPTKLPKLEKPTHWLPEEKARAELDQPGFLEPRTRGVLRTAFNVYPVILSPDYDPAAPILGYREIVGGAGVDRRFGKYFDAQLFYQVQTSFPFTYVGALDASLASVVVSDVDLTTTLDFRDDAIHPHKGVWLSNDLQLAGGPLGGDTRDVKVQPELRAYVPISRRVTFALRGTTGFVFPSNYGQTLENAVPDARDLQLVYFRAFFSGGPNSNRGYPYRGVGPHGIVPFYLPSLAATAAQAAQDCARDPLVCQQPLGGLTLWEASSEIRIALGNQLSTTLFCDASDVSARTVDVRLDHPHLSCGAGLRYDTPVGPIRLDVGMRIPGMQVLGEGDPTDYVPPPLVFGFPGAISIAIGEAF